MSLNRPGSGDLRDKSANLVYDVKWDRCKAELTGVFSDSSYFIPHKFFSLIPGESQIMQQAQHKV